MQLLLTAIGTAVSARYDGHWPMCTMCIKRHLVLDAELDGQPVQMRNIFKQNVKIGYEIVIGLYVMNVLVSARVDSIIPAVFW